jgi:hypothetical protein
MYNQPFQKPVVKSIELNIFALSFHRSLWLFARGEKDETGIVTNLRTNLRSRFDCTCNCVFARS